MIDENSKSPPDYFPIPLAEVDMNSSKVKPASNKLGIIDEQITVIPRSEEYHIKDPTKKLMSKADTSVASLKTSNEQESSEKTLTNVFLSEGTLKEDMIDKASESPPDYFPILLAEVDIKSSKVEPTNKHVSKGDTSVTSLKNSNKQELIILEKDEVDSIYEKNLNNALLSEGILKEGMI